MPGFVRLRLFIVLLVLESACHKRQAVVPLPPAPAATQPAPPAISGTTTPAQPAASNPAASNPAASNPAASNPAVKKPVRPATAPAASAAATAPAASAAAPASPAATAPPSTPPSTPPKLGDVLTPEEQKQYSASIDQSLAQARASLNSIGGRALNRNQQAEVEQIRRFMQQAQDSRVSDPAGAKSLAERAKILAGDLAKTFR